MVIQWCYRPQAKFSIYMMQFSLALVQTHLVLVVTYREKNK